MQLPRSLARFNRVVTNRVQGLWAHRLPPWAVIVHRGRRSGREYETPVLAWRHGNRLVVHLYYGPDVDWVQNVLAAGEATVLRAGSRLTLHDPTVVDADTIGASSPVRLLGRPARWSLVATVVEAREPS